MLPSLPRKSGIRQTQTLTFGGIDRRPNAPDGTVVKTTNMGSDKMPCLAPRKPRYLIGQYNNLCGLFAYNGLYTVRGTTIYKDNVAIGSASNSEPKKFAQMLGNLYMFPDKLVINAGGTDTEEPEDVQVPKYEYGVRAYFQNDQSSSRIKLLEDTMWWTESKVKVGDTVTVSGALLSGNNKSAQVINFNALQLAFPAGTFTAQNVYQDLIIREGTPPTPKALVNPMEVKIENLSVSFASVTTDISSVDNAMAGPTIDYDWSAAGIRVGDAIKIEGTGINYELIVREIRNPSLIFYDNSFTAGSGTVTITRSVPDLDGVFAHEGRLWGWKGNTIYASKLDDPLNFNVFDGLEDDSWAVDLDGSGDILGGTTYQGYPTFFKEDRVVRVYGDRPTQFRLMEVSNMGLHPGCGQSVAVAGDTLYYVSRNGVTAYRGGYAQNEHAPFGDYVFTEARAATDGRRYFLSVREKSTQWSVYVYDTVWKCWFCEDGEQMMFSAYDRGNLYMYHRNGKLWLDGHATNPPSAPKESPLVSAVEFGEFTGANWSSGRNTGNPNRKGTVKILLRLTLGTDASVKVKIKFDKDTNWSTIKELTGPVGGSGMRSYYIPIIPRRSDNYRIKLDECVGEWILHSLVREEYSGSPLH